MKNWLRIPAALACLAALAAPARAQGNGAEVRVPQLNIQTQTLDNGLRMVLLEDHSVPVTNVQVWYQVGAKDEPTGHSGFAHLFEHLMFKGSAHMGPEEHWRTIEAIGGSVNAYTTEDVTVFHDTFPSNYLERVLWLEADRMGSLNVDAANFQSEREVVKEERRLRVDNRPYGMIQEDLYDAAFTVHGYHHTAIGSIADLDKATLAEVQDFFRTFYKPNNATLVIVGDFSTAEAVGWAKKYFGGIPRSTTPIPRLTAQEPPQTEQRVVNKSYSNTPLPAVVEGFKIPPQYSPDSYPLDLAGNILAHGESSRLYRTLVYKDRLAVQAGGFGHFTEDPNLFWMYAIMNQGHTAAEGAKAIGAVLEPLRTQPVEAKELEKAKNQTISEYILGRQTGLAKADAIGEAAVIGKDPNLVNTDLDRHMKTSVGDLQHVAQTYLIEPRATVLLLTPQAAAK